MKDGLKVALVSVLVLVGLLSLSWGTGWFGVFYKGTVEKANVSVDRQIFKESKSFVEGMANDLANYRREITTEKDPVARKAIADLINSKYGNFDISRLENSNLRGFLLDVRNGKYDGGNE